MPSNIWTRVWHLVCRRSWNQMAEANLAFWMDLTWGLGRPQKPSGVWQVVCGKSRQMPRTPGYSGLMDYSFQGFPWAGCPLRGGQSQQTPLQPLAHSAHPGRGLPDLVSASHESVVVGNGYMASAVVTTVNKVWSLPVGHAMFHCRQHVRKPQG